MKIVVTGGAGYIGCQLIEELLKTKLPDKILIYDNLSRGHYGIFFQKFDKRVEFYEAELLDSRSLATALQGCDAVFHLAAKVSAPNSNLDSHFFEQINHWGTAELVNQIEDSKVNFFVYLNSSTVYGNSNEPFDEDSPPMPVSFYAHSKMRGENHVSRLFEGLSNAYSIRSGNVYGYNPSVRIDAVINRFVFEAHFQNKILINGSGEQKRAFIHVQKLACFLVNLMVEKPKNGVYNCAQYNFSVNEIVEHLKKCYPNLETTHLNQHIEMPSTELKLPLKLQTHSIWPSNSFNEELLDMDRFFGF